MPDNSLGILALEAVITARKESMALSKSTPAALSEAMSLSELIAEEDDLAPIDSPRRIRGRYDPIRG